MSTSVDDTGQQYVNGSRRGGSAKAAFPGWSGATPAERSTSMHSGEHTSSVRREPIGVVGSIAPWNYPLQMAAWFGKDMSTYSFDEYTQLKHVMSALSREPRKSWHDTVFTG